MCSGLQTLQEMCVYADIMKMLLALDCLQHVITRQVFQSTHDFVEAVAFNTDTCMNGKLLEMRTLCNIPEDDKQIKVTWYTWETTEGLPNKVQKSGTLGDVLNFLKTASTKFAHRCFVKKQQSGFFQAKKCWLKQTRKLIEFAENYIAAYQD